MHNNMLPSLDVAIGGSTAAGATAINLDYTIQDGAMSIVFAVLFGGVTVAGTTGTAPAIRVFQGDLADHTDLTELVGLQTPIVAGMANKQVLLELIKPRHKYIRLQVDRTGNGGNSIAITEQMLIANIFRKPPMTLQANDYSRTEALSL